jgi:hypothetical protein
VRRIVWLVTCPMGGSSCFARFTFARLRIVRNRPRELERSRCRPSRVGNTKSSSPPRMLGPLRLDCVVARAQLRLNGAEPVGEPKEDCFLSGHRLSLPLSQALWAWSEERQSGRRSHVGPLLYSSSARGSPIAAIRAVAALVARRELLDQDLRVCLAQPQMIKAASAMPMATMTTPIPSTSQSMPRMERHELIGIRHSSPPFIRFVTLRHAGQPHGSNTQLLASSERTGIAPPPSRGDFWESLLAQAERVGRGPTRTATRCSKGNDTCNGAAGTDTAVLCEAVAGVP